MAWVTCTGAPPSTWADTGEPIQSKNVTQTHPSMPFIPKYSIVPDTHTDKIKWKGNKSNGTNPQKELSPNSTDSTRVQLCSTKRCASILLDVFSAVICLCLNFASNPKKEWLKTESGERGPVFLGETFNRSVSEGALLSLGLTSMDRELRWLSEWGFPHRKTSLFTFVYLHCQNNVGTNTSHGPNGGYCWPWLDREVRDIQIAAGESNCQQHSPCIWQFELIRPRSGAQGQLIQRHATLFPGRENYKS